MNRIQGTERIMAKNKPPTAETPTIPPAPPFPPIPPAPSPPPEPVPIPPATGEAPVVPLPAVVPPAVPLPAVPPTPPAGATRRAKVTVPHTHVGTIVVEIPADAANPHQVAIEAAKQARGIVAFGSGPEVEFEDG